MPDAKETGTCAIIWNNSLADSPPGVQTRRNESRWPLLVLPSIWGAVDRSTVVSLLCHLRLHALPVSLHCPGLVRCITT
jgi:hypothetical protein